MLIIDCYADDTILCVVKRLKIKAMKILKKR